MKPSELYEALHALISERVPLHIWGACGVGKSQIVAQVAADRKCEFLDILHDGVASSVLPERSKPVAGASAQQ